MGCSDGSMSDYYSVGTRSSTVLTGTSWFYLVSSERQNNTLNEIGRLRQLAQVEILLTCIWEVSGSNLGQDTDFTDQGFVWSFSVPPGKC
jgi:hypothetical protein